MQYAETVKHTGMELLQEAVKTIIGALVGGLIAWLWAMNNRASKVEVEKLRDELGKFELETQQRVTTLRNEMSTHVMTVTVQLTEIKTEFKNLEKMMSREFELLREKLWEKS